MTPTHGTPNPGGDGTVATLGLVRRLQAAVQEDERAAIVEIVRQLVEQHAPLGGQWVSLSHLAAANGEIGLARTAIDVYVEAAVDDPDALYRKVSVLAAIGAWDEALELLRRLPPDRPDPSSYAHSRGTAALYVGETDEARYWLEEALRVNPQVASGWRSLATLIDFADHPVLAERVFASEQTMETAAPSERAVHYYTLGKAHADLGQHARAFEAFSRGADLWKRRSGYSRERDRFTAQDAVSGYDAVRIDDIARRQSEPTERGIFVTGLPRSGTTLAEQILTGHSSVSDGGEIYRLPLLVKDIGGLSYPAVAEYVDAGGLPAAAKLWRHWLDERFPAPGRIVDKSLNTSRLLGLAATLLPEAPLIWLVRDPVDCAWSCFRTRFVAEAPWSYDLEDIAFHFRLEDELLKRWQDLLGDRLLVVPYESLASKPDLWIRKILAHCNLPEEPQAFTPHENPRAVTTASVMQVRQPINSKSIGSAEPYREFLEPFVKAYRGKA